MKKIILIVAVAGLIVAFWIVLSRLITLQQAQRISVELSHYAERHTVLIFAALVGTQLVGMILSLPSKAIVTLLSGALLGTVMGSLATLIGVLSGTTILFFLARYFLRDRVSQKLGSRFSAIEERLSGHPVRAMMGLRLFITLPYGPITLVSAVSPIRYRDFLVGSLLGDLPVIVVYCMAGKELLSLTKMSEAISPWTVGAFVAVAALFIVGALFKKKQTRVHLETGD